MQAIDVIGKAASLAHQGYQYLARRSRRGSEANRPVEVRTCYTGAVQLSSGRQTLSLADTSADSVCLSELGDIYRWYRFKEVIIEMPSPEWTTANHVAVTYIPASVTSATTFANTEAPHMLLMSASQTVPGRLRIPIKSLEGGLKWYMSNGAATDPNLEVQGTIVFQSSVSSTEILTFKVTAICEFKELLDPTSIALALEKREAIRKLVKKLQSCDTPRSEIRKAVRALVSKTK
jgi:hypothetical protein